MASEIAGNQFAFVGRSYFGLAKNSPVSEFHGLRDFYSFCRHLRNGFSLNRAVQRNFGGLDPNLFPNGSPTSEFILPKFGLDSSLVYSSIDLIYENISENSSEDLRDSGSRHLMVISDNNYGAFLLRARFPDIILIEGNLFGTTTSEDRLQQLQQIKKAMELGYIIMLRNAAHLYESLYDVLNKRETIIGQKRYSVVSDGYQSQSCVISPGFKLILLVETKEAMEELAPPFLNRFEKHFLKWDANLEPKLLQKVKEWAIKIGNGSTRFADMFVGYHPDFFSNLVSLPDASVTKTQSLLLVNFTNHVKVALQC
jgi:hypothetical protein